MRSVHVVLAGVPLLFLSGCRHRDVAKEVAAREHQVQQAFNTGDTALASDLIADDFIGIEPDGARYNKAEAISDVRDFPKSGIVLTTDGVTVQDLGKVAVARGFDHYSKKDGTAPRTGMWTDVWAWRGGKWRIVAAQDGWMK